MFLNKTFNININLKNINYTYKEYIEIYITIFNDNSQSARCIAVPVFGNVPRSALAYRKGKKQLRLDMFLQAASLYVKG
jgi:hypothetical protein